MFRLSFLVALSVLTSSCKLLEKNTLSPGFFGRECSYRFQQVGDESGCSYRLTATDKPKNDANIRANETAISAIVETTPPSLLPPLQSHTE